jgi:hypothetical protein
MAPKPSKDPLSAISDLLLEPQDPSSLAPLNVIRTESVLSRFPVHNLAKKGRIAIEVLHKNTQGDVDIRWEVSYNDRYGQARQLAYKLDTIVVNRRIEEEGRPVPKLIRLGSLRDIAQQLEIKTNTNLLKVALRQNASTFITVKLSYTTIEGQHKTLEADFTRYSVIFTGESLPDGSKADAVYLNLNDVYWTILNEAPWRPQDYDYLKALAPAAQRFYEIVSFRFYNALRFENPNASKMTYSEYCAYSAQQRYFDYEHFKKQMFKVHQPHRKSGYLSSVSYEATQDPQGRPDWIMRYVPGPKAVNEYQYFTGRTGVLERKLETKHTLSASLQNEPNIDLQLMTELAGRGIDDKHARILLQNLKPGQDVMAQLEYADYKIASAPAGTYRNPPGFYVSVVRENQPVPSNFEDSRKRRERSGAEQENALEQSAKAEMEIQYEEHKRRLVDSYIRHHLAAGDYEAMLDEIKRNYIIQFRNAAQWPAATLHSIAVNAAAVEIARRMPMATFDEFCRQHRK